MVLTEIAALGREPSAISLEPFVVAHLEQHGPSDTAELEDAIEAAWRRASGAPLRGDVRPLLRRALDGLAARGRVAQEGVFGVWRVSSSVAERADAVGAPRPLGAGHRSLEEQLDAIGTEVRELVRALDEARRTIEIRETELAGLREANEQHVTTICLLEGELAEQSRLLGCLREKVADLNLALES